MSRMRGASARQTKFFGRCLGGVRPCPRRALPRLTLLTRPVPQLPNMYAVPRPWARSYPRARALPSPHAFVARPAPFVSVSAALPVTTSTTRTGGIDRATWGEARMRPRHAASAGRGHLKPLGTSTPRCVPGHPRPLGCVIFPCLVFECFCHVKSSTPCIMLLTCCKP